MQDTNNCMVLKGRYRNNGVLCIDIVDAAVEASDKIVNRKKDKIGL